MIGIPLGLATANVAEWVIHKHILHGRGKNPKSFWNFHMDEHHVAALRNEGRDPDYERPPIGWHAQGKELLGLAMLAVPVVPLLPIAPFFTGTLVYCGINYYRAHKRAHLDPEWARTHLPWHYDHHMGPDQDQNWCVTKPWFDHVMGTRRRFVGTPAEGESAARRARVAAERARAKGIAAGVPTFALDGARHIV